MTEGFQYFHVTIKTDIISCYGLQNFDKIA